MGITLDQLVYDASNPDDGANVGAHIRSGDDGTAIGHVGDALKVDIGSVTDLDIRDLAFATDSVDVSGSEVSLDAATLAALESVTVSATDLDIRDLTHVSDSVKVGDGTEFLAINTDGSINTKFAAPSNPQTSVSTVGTTAVEIAATPLTDRTRILVQNNGSKAIYIGEDNTVTTSTGICLPKGASMELPYGETANIFAISGTAGQNVRVLELD